MILYHPFSDAHHCIYRLLSILNAIETPISQKRLQIMDFYYLFPSQLKKINKWPRRGSRLSLFVNDIPDQYENILNNKRIFFELKDIQDNTIKHLLSKDLIIVDSKEMLIINEKNVPEVFFNIIGDDSFIKSRVFEVITKELIKIKFNGENGLKDKSGLLEFTYDII